MRRANALVASGIWLVLAGCNTHQDTFVRGQKAFEQNAHERALAHFRRLEPNLDHLSSPERTQYAYLRGMTDYRIGLRGDARHWLAIARVLEDESPGALPVDWKARADEALAELNDAVYDEGIERLGSRRPDDASKARP